MKIAFVSEAAVFLEDGRVLIVHKELRWNVQDGKVMLTVKDMPKGYPDNAASKEVQEHYQASLAKLVVE